MTLTTFVAQGGDEVSFTCWESNPQIQAWMAANPNISTYADLEAYYELNLSARYLDCCDHLVTPLNAIFLVRTSLKILEEQGTSYICWEDVFVNGVPLLSNTVVDVWEDATWQTVIAQVTAVRLSFQP
jgi:hexosaminidase